jgi:hypothetical protein
MYAKELEASGTDNSVCQVRIGKNEMIRKMWCQARGDVVERERVKFESKYSTVDQIQGRKAWVGVSRRSRLGRPEVVWYERRGGHAAHLIKKFGSGWKFGSVESSNLWTVTDSLERTLQHFYLSDGRAYRYQHDQVQYQS